MQSYTPCKKDSAWQPVECAAWNWPSLWALGFGSVLVKGFYTSSSRDSRLRAGQGLGQLSTEALYKKHVLWHNPSCSILHKNHILNSMSNTCYTSIENACKKVYPWQCSITYTKVYNSKRDERDINIISKPKSMIKREQSIESGCGIASWQPAPGKVVKSLTDTKHGMMHSCVAVQIIIGISVSTKYGGCT